MSASPPQRYMETRTPLGCESSYVCLMVQEIDGPADLRCDLIRSADQTQSDGRFFSVPVGRYRVPGCWWLPVPVFYPRLRLLGLTQPFGYGRAHPFLFDVVAGSHVFSRQGEFRAVVGKTGHHRVRQCCL